MRPLIRWFSEEINRSIIETWKVGVVGSSHLCCCPSLGLASPSFYGSCDGGDGGGKVVVVVVVVR